MAYNQYSGYGGNPYEQSSGGYGGQQAGGYGSSNPYGADAGNPYGGGSTYREYDRQPTTGTTNLQHQTSNYSATSRYDNEPHNALPLPTQPQGSHGLPNQGQEAAPPLPGHRIEYVQPGPTVLSNQDFLSRVEAVKADIRTLTIQVGNIASMHQRTLSSPDQTSSNSQLESLITQTQVLNTSIKDQIKFLETDAARSRDNQVKNTQIQQLKTSFQKQLQEYRSEEASYERRYREQIARQYRIVNPEATEGEVREAANADWGNEGVFQTALRSNRSATANTVLGAVRARHNDIQKIERTMIELNALMEDLATTIALQDVPVQQVEKQTGQVKDDTEAGNVQLDKGIDSAKRARKLKWWCLAITILIIIILAVVLGVVFGVVKKGTGS